MGEATDIPEMLTPDETATILLMKPSTLARWRWCGKGPRYVKYGKIIRYRKQDVLDFIESSVREHTANGFDSNRK